jgi:hypothetical protein
MTFSGSLFVFSFRSGSDEPENGRGAELFPTFFENLPAAEFRREFTSFRRPAG